MDHHCSGMLHRANKIQFTLHYFQGVILSIIRLAWASAGGNLALMVGSMEELHAPFVSIKENQENSNLSQEDVALCREALDVLALAVALYPQSLDNLCKDKSWHTFIIDLVIFSPVQEIRLTASDQFLLIATRYFG